MDMTPAKQALKPLNGIVESQEVPPHVLVQALKLYSQKPISLLNAMREVGIRDTFTACRIIQQNDDFNRLKELAVKDKARNIAEETLKISDDTDEDASSRTIRCKTRQWLASRYDRKAYGDKIDIKSESNIRVEVVVPVFKD